RMSEGAPRATAAGEQPGRASAALGLRGLTVERGGRAVVRDVSIGIPAGEVTARPGANGAGESSLVLALGGVLRPPAAWGALGGIGGPRRARVRGPPAGADPPGRDSDRP